MDAAKGTFRAVEAGAQRLHGQTALLLCGHTPEEQRQFLRLLEQAQLAHLPVIVVTAATASQPLDALTALPDRTGLGEDSALPRAIIMSGLVEMELHTLMDAHRHSGQPRPLWAAATPGNASWSATRLLTELQRERDALGRAARRSP